MNKEDYFISLFKSKKIGDDGAVIGDYIYSNDAFFENVHFKKEWLSLDQIAYKAMIVNISDAIAMNAKPLYALLSIAIPNTYSKNDLKLLHKGFKKASKEFKIDIIGGDTISNNKLDISITIISKTKKPLLRTGIKKGDYLAYTGKLGGVKKDLDRLFENKKIDKNSRFIKPILRQKFIKKSASFLRAGMDISDGLFLDLEKLAKANNIGFNFFKKIKKNKACSGEEYEMLIAIDPKNIKKVKEIAKKEKIELHIFAKADQSIYKNRCLKNHF